MGVCKHVLHAHTRQALTELRLPDHAIDTDNAHTRHPRLVCLGAAGHACAQGMQMVYSVGSVSGVLLHEPLHCAVGDQKELTVPVVLCMCMCVCVYICIPMPCTEHTCRLKGIVTCTL